MLFRYKKMMSNRFFPVGTCSSSCWTLHQHHIFIITIISPVYLNKVHLSASSFSTSEPPRYHFDRPENYISMYHQEGSDTLYVGGRATIYVLNFTDRGVDNQQVNVTSDWLSWPTQVESAHKLFLICKTLLHDQRVD